MTGRPDCTHAVNYQDDVLQRIVVPFFLEHPKMNMLMDDNVSEFLLQCQNLVLCPNEIKNIK